MSMRYFPLILILMGHLCFGDEKRMREPANVPSIRQDCLEIDKQLPAFRKLSFGDSITYVDSHQHVRKVQGRLKSPKGEKPDSTEEWIYYFDQGERPLFAFRKGASTDLGRQTAWENRFYFKDWEVTAWKKGNEWVPMTSESWERATAEVRMNIKENLEGARSAYVESLPE